MKKYIFLKFFFLTAFVLFASFNSTLANPDAKEIKQIESYFDTDEIDKLLYLISDESTKNQFPSINKLTECSKWFSSDVMCPLDRSKNPKYRKIFENKIVKEFEKNLMPNLVQKDELFLTYTSFGCGYLFQDFVILNKIIRLIEYKYTEIQKINLNLNLIDIIINSPKINKSKRFSEALKQFLSYLQNKKISISINTTLYHETNDYIKNSLNKSDLKSDLITCSDYESYSLEYELHKDGLKSILLNCLKLDGYFFNLDRIGTIRTPIQQQKAFELIKIKLTKDYLLNKYSNYFKEATPDPITIPGTKMILRPDNPILFYGQINPDLFLLSEINAIHPESGKEFKTTLIETTME
ncbi:MAG: hypothetical protein ABIA74_06115 [bacterium]